MNILEVKNLNFGYVGEELLKNISFRLLPNDHLGLVGANGSGKTTLLNLIATRLIPDSGDVLWDRAYQFSYLDQHLEIISDKTIESYLYETYVHLFEKENEMNKYYDSLNEANPSMYDKIISKAENILEYLEENHFYMIKSKISNIINGLGIDANTKRLLSELSGGQRVKVYLGKMLLEEKDVLLLDEPTNFLDAVHVEWLSKFLNNYKHPFIIISHDISFLNNIANGILSIENKTINKYKGNYNKYMVLKKEKDVLYEKAYEKQKQYISKTEDFIKKNIERASTSKRAKSRVKDLEKLTILEKPTTEKHYKLSFPFTHSFNSEAITTTNLEIGYDYPLLKPINIKIFFGEKVVISGPNGIGKTTFIKTILNKIPSLGGKFKIPDYNDILYYEQDYNGQTDITPLDYIRSDYPTYDDRKIRSILSRYGLTKDLVLKPLSELSGGELTKVRFAKLTIVASNLLILDEPTNHLDKACKEALAIAINNYPGTVVIISHEKEFYRKLNMKEIKMNPFEKKK